MHASSDRTGKEKVICLWNAYSRAHASDQYESGWHREAGALHVFPKQVLYSVFPGDRNCVLETSLDFGVTDRSLLPSSDKRRP